MALEQYQSDMETCCRCSACKFIPLEKVKGYQPVNICPSITYNDFHAYSGGGRMGIGVAILENRLEFTDKLLDVVYNCMTCGGCDISCKYAMDMEVLKPILETRITCVENGYTLPVLDRLVASLRTQGHMVPGTKAKRGDWLEGKEYKDYNSQQCEVIYHAGCRTCYNKDMWKVAQKTVDLLQKAGVDIGIAGDNESCCGGRAYQTGYKEDAIKQAEKNMAAYKKAGVKTLVTGCADCYHAFKVLYDEFGLKGDLEVLHTTEYFARLLNEGKLKPVNAVNMTVTYHDPCHLGRLGEPYIHWEGKQIPGHIRIYDPPKEFRRGTYGIYKPPREILRNIPGVKLIEMQRIKEYAWCCGAGGGVTESNPEFAAFTAGERISEAEITGAEAIATACPGCETSFGKSINENGSSLKVFDVIELLHASVV
ncbi:MAG: (Fe-S)-binding protein [Dehalococcoidales bacterium]|nr:(Fe-S)-binding protein [Dehalococcoidales bacterium]